MTRSRTPGFVLATVVVFGAVFLTIGLGIVGYLLTMQRAEEDRINGEQAFDIAEAGLNYYAWHLYHFPTDLKDGTGGSGPYVHEYQDPEGGTAGTFSLSINGNLQCNSPTVIDITSTGATAGDPTLTSSVFGRYAQESVANYAYITNVPIWFGSSSTVYGRVLSNSGVRMDGSNLSEVESAVSSWTCTSSYGCSSNTNEPGVFGTGGNPALWVYPVPQVSFGNISVNLSSIKTAAKSDGGLYFPQASGSANQRGYHLIFNTNGTVDVYQVTATTPVWSYSNANGWAQEYNIIASQTYLGNYTIPSSCSAIFVEDRAWIEGTLKGKVTVAAADLTGDGGANPDIILPNNITYAAYDGSDGLTAIAEGNVLIPLNSPDQMTVHGIFVAQNGEFGRNFYYYQNGGQDSVPSQYASDVLRTSLTAIGSFVYDEQGGVAWGSPVTSGYQTRSYSYDGTLANDPPPFTPYASSQYNIILWRQE